MIVDRAGGYVSMDRELWVKLLWENVKEKGLRFVEGRSPGVEDSHWIKEDMRQWIVSSGKKQRKDEGKLRVEIVEPRIPEGIVTSIQKGHASLDRGLWVKFSGSKRSLRIETPEA
jgi:hypothetical protein